LDFPYGIAVDRAGNVHVTDSNNDRVEKFSAEGVFLTTWGTFGTAAGQLSNPLGIAITPGGAVLVVDNGNDRVQRFTADGTFVRAWGWGVTDGLAKLETCTSACRAGISGSGAGQFESPSSVAVTGSGRVLITDNGNDRVEKFRAAGAFVAASSRTRTGSRSTHRGGSTWATPATTGSSSSR
jgi:DNA-binding beta-propeller fold protein YncE